MVAVSHQAHREAMHALLRAQLEEQLGGPTSPWYHLLTRGVVDQLAYTCDEWCGYERGSWLWALDAMAGPLFALTSSVPQRYGETALIVARKGGSRAWQGEVVARLWARCTRAGRMIPWRYWERVVGVGEWQQAERKARLALQGPGPWPREPVW